MNLPSYDKTKRKKSFQALPKDAYVIKIKSVREDTWPSGDGCLRIAFDIAEGEYKDFYQKQFDANTNEDKKWPMDAVFTLNIPSDGSQQYVWDNWNTFFADLEDSNGGFAFGGDVKTLKGKVIGGLFHIRQNENNGTVYDHTVMRWTRPADDVRSGKFGKLPNDKLIGSGKGKASASTDSEGFMVIPDGEEEEFPF